VFRRCGAAWRSLLFITDAFFCRGTVKQQRARSNLIGLISQTTPRHAAASRLRSVHRERAQVVSADQMQKGFQNLVEGLDDTLLDVPDAVVSDLYHLRSDLISEIDRSDLIRGEI